MSMNGSVNTPVTRSVTVGVTGQPCRSDVTPWGSVRPWRSPFRADPDGGGAADAAEVSWYVAAEDRWHVPAEETAVRQRRLDGTPVVETRLRIPDGDAVQRIWAVPELGGLTVIEVENESPLPFAVAFAGERVLTERPPADVEIEGIELPPGAFVLPVGHRSTVRVAVPHDPARITTWALPRLQPWTSVVAGWTTTLDRASRLGLPDEGLVEAVAAARSDLLLAGPVEADDDVTGFLFDVAELVRLGDPGDVWLPEIVEPVAAIGRRQGGDVDRALVAVERLAVSAGDERAADDLARLWRRRAKDRRTADSPEAPTPLSALQRGPSVGRFVADVERLVADGGRLLTTGVPRRWLGQNFEVHGIPTGPRSTVSFAVRWHGERPAVLWEQTGIPIELSAPAVDAQWSSAEAAGEALWAAPAAPTRLGLSVEVGDR